MRLLLINIVLLYTAQLLPAQDRYPPFHLADRTNAEELRCSISPGNELLFDRYKEGKRIERISVSTSDLDPLSIAIDPSSRSLRMACLADRPHCFHRDLFTRSASMRTSRVDAILPDGPHDAHALMEWMRGTLGMNVDLDTAPLVETRP